MFINRKMRRQYSQNQHHNIYTKKYPTKRARQRSIELLKFTLPKIKVRENEDDK